MGDRTGEQLGAYTVGAHVADGSMGSVYEARHSETGERVAVKVLHPEVASDAVAVQRFRREYETAKSLCHAYIIDARDFGATAGGAHFMTMELLEGEELSLVLVREGGMRPARLVRVVSQLALALHHAHTHGVIHRDLKPDNILLCAGAHGDEVRVLDFGSVKRQVESGPKLTAFGTTLGSPYYMSPEQAMGKLDLDQRTDVFALAAIMHELATGQVAFPGDSVAAILKKIADEEPPPVSTSSPDYPWSFDDVVKQGLRKDKVNRFGNTMELANAMLRALGSNQVSNAGRAFLFAKSSRPSKLRNPPPCRGRALRLRTRAAFPQRRPCATPGAPGWRLELLVPQH
ncbi:MAG: serine/threonine-protein kinase [Deltaproteobacteria bacterium]